MASPYTIHPNYRQVVFSITLDFRLVYTQYGPPEQGSSFKKIFLVAPFEKNPKLIVIFSYFEVRIFRVVRRSF